MKKAIIISGELTQDHEFIYPYYRLKGEGFKVITALKDTIPCKGILGTNIPPDKDARIVDYEELNVDDYDLLIIPGGAKAMEKLRQEESVLLFISRFNATGKIIASICHGAQLLISAKVVEGRAISGYYSIKDDIVNAGADYIDSPYVRDKNIISCPHYKYLGEWMNEVIKEYENKNIKKR